MPDQLTFPVCGVPGCAMLVNVWGCVCGGCVAAFGDMLRPCPVRLDEAEIRDRDAETARAYAMQRAVGRAS